MGKLHILKTECTKCGCPRSQVEHFYLYGGKRERRLRSICKPCHIAEGGKRRKLNPKKYNEQVKSRYRTSVKSRAYGLWKRAQQRAIKNKMEFSISRNAVESWLELGVCAVTGYSLICPRIEIILGLLRLIG